MSIAPASRHLLGLALAAVTAAVSSSADAQVQPASPEAATVSYAGPLFDAHLHYNEEARPRRTRCEDVLGRMQRSGVHAMVANCRPNDGTRALAEARRNPRRRRHRVPFIRLYRNRADYEQLDPRRDDRRHGAARARRGNGAPGRTAASANSTSTTAATPTGRSRGADGSWPRRRGLVVLAHVDDVAIEKLFAHAPKARLIWAHTGIGGAPMERVRALLAAVSALMRRALLSSGADRWRRPAQPRVAHADPEMPEPLPGRLGHLDQRSAGKTTRGRCARPRPGWATCPPAVARRIAWDNGAGLFGLPAP